MARIKWVNTKVSTVVTTGLTYQMIAYILLLSTTDNDQGEKVILAVVVDAPETNIRKVVIWSDDKEEKITLYLRRGDA